MRKHDGGVRDDGVKSRLVGALERNFRNPILAILITLIAGLPRQATPCVYPMIPSRADPHESRGGHTRKGARTRSRTSRNHPHLRYSRLCGRDHGRRVQRAHAIPLVILGFAVLFALLGLSMLGFFEIQIPASIATKVDSSTASHTGFVGTMLMGVGADSSSRRAWGRS